VGKYGNQKRIIMDYQEIKSYLEDHKDRNCCTVVASSIAFNVPFPEMQNYFFIHMGRKMHRGIRFGLKQANKVAKNYGYQLKDICMSDFKVQGKLTPNNCVKHLGKGTYILGCRGHVLAFKDGVVQDWTKGRRHHINRIWKVEKSTKNVKSSQKSISDLIKEFKKG
jgi:hypothetical protein